MFLWYQKLSPSDSTHLHFPKNQTEQAICEKRCMSYALKIFYHLEKWLKEALLLPEPPQANHYTTT